MAVPLPSHLPDLCLENIFKRVPLRDLLRSARVVCSNWHRVAPTELKRRRSVVLVQDYQRDVEKIRDNENPFRNDSMGHLMAHVRRVDGSPWLPPLVPLDQIGFDALLVPGGVLSEKFTSPLMDTLPVVSNLTVVQYHTHDHSFSAISSLQQMIHLINNYANSLVSLKIDFTHYIINDSLNAQIFRNDLMTNCAILLDSTSQLESLRHLTLNGTLLGLTGTLNLPILSRLNTFTSNYIVPKLMDSIRQYANENIRIHCNVELSSQEIFVIDPQMATKFISLYFGYGGFLDINHYDNMRQFGVRFTSLTRLQLLSYHIPMTMLARCLSPLTQLIELEVKFIGNVPQNEVPQPELTQVQTVRLLSVSIRNSTTHFDTERLHLAELFPNLQVLKFCQNIVSCTECGLDNIERMIGLNINTEGRRRRIEQCLRLALVPFRHCSNLHTIKLQGTPEYFLPNEWLTAADL